MKTSTQRTEKELAYTDPRDFVEAFLNDTECANGGITQTMQDAFFEGKVNLNMLTAEISRYVTAKNAYKKIDHAPKLHTPGQWYLNFTSTGALIVKYTKTAGKTLVIAELKRSENYSENAKLIAEAPKLLKALEHIVERINTVQISDHFAKGFCEAIRQVSQQAINEATAFEQ